MPPDLPPPVLEVFYSPTCAPCRLELPAVAEIAGAGGTRVRIVILDQEERTRSELRAVSPQLDAIATSREVGGEVGGTFADAEIPHFKELILLVE